MSTEPESDFSQRLANALNAARSQDSAPAPATPGPDAPDQPDDFNDRLASQMAGMSAPPAEEQPAPEPTAEPVEETRPLGNGPYVVRKGDCISSIALETGHFPDTIWNAPENEVLRTARQDMNVLLPGDRLFLPELRRRDEACAAEQRHRFKRRGVPEMLQIGFEDEDGQPYTGEAFTIEIDGEQRSGFCDGDGFVREPIPPDAQKATITFAERNEVYKFELGELQPIGSTMGVQQRLKNLGFYSGRPNGQMDDKTTSAIRRFQTHYALPSQQGVFDQETQTKLQQVHRS